MTQVRTKSFGRNERRYFFLTQKITQEIKQSNVVLLAGWESPAYWQILFSTLRYKTRVVGFYESTLKTNRHTRGFIAAFRRWFFQRLDAVVVPGVAAQEAVLKMGVDPRRIFLGFNAVEVELFSAATTNSSIAQTSGHKYIYVGQLIARKNLFAVLEAFSNCHHESDSLTLVGTGELESRLRSAAIDLGLENKVIFLGSVPNDALPNILATHHTLVLASTEEVWGLVVNEALAAGLHVVVSDSAGSAPSVQGMAGVYLVNPICESITKGLSDSRKDWKGLISNPEILEFTPAKFAEVFLSALSVDTGD